MTLDKDDLIGSILASLDRIDNIKLEEIPDIDLYMDQLTTFMEERLQKATRYPGEDKVLTKTMINNYAKNDLLPPPIRKKYSKDHIILLIFIFYFKNILTINDIQTLIEPLKERFHISDEELSLSEIYKSMFNLEGDQAQILKDDITEKYNYAAHTFEDYDGDDKEKMQMFAFISQLGYDVYLKKLIIEKILDNYRAEYDAKKAAELGRAKAEKEALMKQKKEKRRDTEN